MDNAIQSEPTHPPAFLEMRTQKIWLREDGILQIHSFPGSEQELRDAEENIRAASLLAGGKRRPALVDLRKIKSMSREARLYYAGEETAKVESAAALLVDSAVSRVIGNMFMGLNKPIIPTRLFTSEEEALQWLKGFLEEA